jgi:histidinol-phosphate aminotransferase
MASHTFPQYKHNAEVEGATCIEVPLVDGKHDLPGMLAKVNARTKIVWICNPNNPTGTMVTHAEVLAFLEQCPKHVIVVLDEAYAEYNTEQDYPDAFALLEQFPNVLVLRTFSKIYGLAALRIGFGVGRPEMIHTINQVREPFNTTRYAQAAALAAIDDQAFIDTCRAQNKAGMEYLEQEIARLGLSSYPSNGNFIMIHVNRPAKLVFEGLLKRGVIVRGGHSLDFPTSIRVTIGSPAQNKAFIETLEVVLAEVEVGV